MAETVLVTGAAGFIGYHVAARLLSEGRRVVGLDNFNTYYDPALKRARWAQLERLSGFTPAEIDTTDLGAVEDLFARFKPGKVVHLAAQAGVRYSLVDPHAYAASNLVGFLSILESCRKHSVNHLVYASTSSVYGADTDVPFKESARANHPLSLYAATKKSNEAMAHAYAHLFGIPTTGLRFFTVYGPWGRPDMAVYSFTKAIFEGGTIVLFNEGEMWRDFTYVDDVVDGVARVLDKPAAPNKNWQGEAAESLAPWRLFNIGDDRPVLVKHLVTLLETAIGKKAIIENQPAPASDPLTTHADISALRAYVGYEPRVSLEEGVARFVAWYRSYHRI
jgi:UDP-glucuronate 4-epimerase